MTIDHKVLSAGSHPVVHPDFTVVRWGLWTEPLIPTPDYDTILLFPNLAFAKELKHLARVEILDWGCGDSNFASGASILECCKMLCNTGLAEGVAAFGHSIGTNKRTTKPSCSTLYSHPGCLVRLLTNPTDENTTHTAKSLYSTNVDKPDLCIVRKISTHVPNHLYVSEPLTAIRQLLS